MEVSFPTSSNLKIKIPNNDKCESLGAKIKRAKPKDFTKEDERGPARAVVFDDDEKETDWKKKYRKLDWQNSPTVQHCYNIKRLGRWGICETDNPEYNFGFCSSSCVLPNPESAFWMDMKANYHECEYYSATGGLQSKHRQLP